MQSGSPLPGIQLPTAQEVVQLPACGEVPKVTGAPFLTTKVVSPQL